MNGNNRMFAFDIIIVIYKNIICACVKINEDTTFI